MTKQPIAVRGAWEPGRRRRSAPVPCLLLEKADQQAATISSAFDPEETFGQAPSCNRQRHNSLTLTAYSITSSARSKNDSGIVRPIALAVLRFTAISNFVGN